MKTDNTDNTDKTDNTNKPNFVGIKEIKIFKPTEPNFFANNILVHNCVESFSLTKVASNWKTQGDENGIKTIDTDGIFHSCSLVSINLANILNNTELLKQACETSVRMLDASIDLGTMPVKEAEISAKGLRNIGIGVVGLADWMAFNKLMYDTEEGINQAECLIEKISYYCYKSSIELAKEKGSYPWFNQANYDTLFGKKPQELNQLSRNNFDWVQLANEIKEFGIRNFYLLSFAPNTSTAAAQGVTPSYLPVYSKDSTQTIGDIIVPVLPKFIKDRFWFYKTKFQYKPEDIIKFTTRLQRWIDTGISMEININPEITDIKKISDTILSGFQSKELKGVYYSLTIDKLKNESCSDCAN